MTHKFMLLVSVVAGSAALLFTLPGVVPVALGCSGAEHSPTHYSADAWTSATWAVDPTGVPIDGAVRLALTANYQHGYSPQDGGTGQLQISVRGPDQTLVPGTPDTVPSPAPQVVEYGETLNPTTIVTWRPNAQFLPSSAYTLRVEGLQDEPIELTFTTGSEKFQPPRPVMSNPTLSVSLDHHSGETLECGYYFQGSSCLQRFPRAQTMIQPAPLAGAQLDADEPVAAAKTFLNLALQVSVNGEPFKTFPETPAALEGVKGNICIREIATNVLTGTSALSSEWCASTDSLDLNPSPNCAAMSEVLAECEANSSNIHLQPEAEVLATYHKLCDSTKTAPAPADSATAEEGGCSITSGTTTTGFGIASLLAGLAAVVFWCRRRLA